MRNKQKIMEYLAFVKSKIGVMDKQLEDANRECEWFKRRCDTL